MSVSTVRKERERAEREQRILEEAERLLRRDGFQDLNLDELARAIEYSKGILYLHFRTKEDLVLSVVTRALKLRADLLERGARFNGTTRERMRALSLACCHFAYVQREYFTVEMMLKSRSFWERASEERRGLHQAQTGRIFHIVNELVIAAAACGDLPAGTKSQEVTLSLIAMTLGSHCATVQPDLQLLCAVEDPLASLRLHHERILDGWGWKPQSADLDSRALDRRIRDEVFPEAVWLKL